MSFRTNLDDIGLFASGTWEDIGSPSDISVASISGWAETHIGDLNILIDSDFDISGSFFSPPLGNTEKSIYQLMYRIHYYDKRVVEMTNGIFANSISDWSSMKEGDSSITRTNRGELIKSLRGSKQDEEAKLQLLVGFYKHNLSLPLQVAGDDAAIEPVYN